jgi:hypothetical protein
VTSALRLTFREQSSHCFKTLLFTHAFGTASIAGTRFEMSNGPIVQSFRAGAHRRISTVVAASGAAVEMSSPVTTSLHRATHGDVPPTSGNQVTSTLGLTSREQTSHCFKTFCFTHAFCAANIAGKGFEMSNDPIVSGFWPNAHGRITTVVAARIGTIEMSGPIATALH